MEKEKVLQFTPIDLHSGNVNKERAVAMMDRYNGRVIDTFPSVREAGRKTGIKSSNITACLNGRLKTAGGYCWLYVYDGGRGIWK